MRAAITNIANTAVDALPTTTRAKCRNGSGQLFANDVVSIRPRMPASAAKAIPAAARIKPNCR